MENNVCRFSIDVEAGGDNPYDRALLEVGICVIGDESQCFNIMFKPDPLPYDRHALAAIRRPIQEFIDHGVELVVGINAMLDWIDETASGKTMEFLGLNMPYDWMFFKVCVAKARAVNTLPHKAYDIPSYGAGVLGVPLSTIGDSRILLFLKRVAPSLIDRYSLQKDKTKPHTALDDAKYQSRLLRALEEYAVIGARI